MSSQGKKHYNSAKVIDCGSTVGGRNSYGYDSNAELFEKNAIT